MSGCRFESLKLLLKALELVQQITSQPIDTNGFLRISERNKLSGYQDEKMGKVWLP
jgi:hypothetical protein